MRRQYDSSIHMMEEICGSFARALAAAWYAADQNNRSRLHIAFADYFERYKKMFEEHKANGRGGA